ncbi:MAG: glycerol-3-phosphate 1-O-acyltransferase PlsY [Verrucomicrobiota bacterium]|nr:glycerol-3-phosphate 1-O-acyltransferase PlsY [Verrucomicrobiota bacterium]
MIILVLLFSYLLGSIPFGFLVAKARGIDIRTVGSGNIGATNVLRFVGKKWGIFVFVCDTLKGLATVLIAKLFCPHVQLSCELFCIFAGVACILGHNYTCWLKFKGGKGVATSAGVVFGLFPLPGLIIFLIWLALYYATRYVAVASMLAAIALPISVWVLQRSTSNVNSVDLTFSILIALLVVVRHRTNIKRLLDGTEYRFDRSPK